MTIVGRTRARIEQEVDPILANVDAGLGRYLSALEVLKDIGIEVEQAGRWYDPRTWIDQTRAFRLLSSKAEFINMVCSQVASRLIWVQLVP